MIEFNKWYKIDYDHSITAMFKHRNYAVENLVQRNLKRKELTKDKELEDYNKIRKR